MNDFSFKKVHMPDFDMKGWESPINLIQKYISNEISEKVDNEIRYAIKTQLSVNIDENELIKAMNYDRQQYRKGFGNGYSAAVQDVIDYIHKDLEHGYIGETGYYVTGLIDRIKSQFKNENGVERSEENKIQ